MLEALGPSKALCCWDVAMGGRRDLKDKRATSEKQICFASYLERQSQVLEC